VCAAGDRRGRLWPTHTGSNYIYVASPNLGGKGEAPLVDASGRPVDPGYTGEDGSNTWAVSAKKSASGHALLLGTRIGWAELLHLLRKRICRADSDFWRQIGCRSSASRSASRWVFRTPSTA
jgi:hypothetical protein